MRVEDLGLGSVAVVNVDLVVFVGCGVVAVMDAGDRRFYYCGRSPYRCRRRHCWLLSLLFVMLLFLLLLLLLLLLLCTNS